MDLLRIRQVAALPGYRLRLTLTDGNVVERDISALLEGPLFGVIREGDMFSEARVVEDAIEWPNGADICPDLLIWGGLPPDSEGARPPRELVLTLEHLAREVPARAVDSGFPVTGSRVERSARRPTATPTMPEISRFFGIVVSMNYDDHAPPHFHVRYGGEQASVAIRPLQVLAGSIPPRALGFVMEWASLHGRELLDDWRLSEEHRPLIPIDPLE